MGMSKSNTGGQAFPMNWVKQEAPNLNVILEQRGMTLRDYFAAKAMQSMLPFYANRPEDIQDMANKAYAMADLMLKAREE
jgi:hypothetical protein